MSERGQYGNSKFNGSAIPTEQGPWWKDWKTWLKIGAGVAVVGGVYQFWVKPQAREMETKTRELRALAKQQREAHLALK